MSSVLVLAGGTSDERPVSLRSGAAVTAALKQKGHSVRELDPAAGLVAADLEGVDMVFPVLHGAGGEDGSLQSQLEAFGVRYVGSGAAASRLCFDKWRYKQLLTEKNMPTPDGALVDQTAFWQSELIKQPFILKPNDGGSSIDNILARESAALDKAAIGTLFAKHSEMLLERLIIGTEITVAVLGDASLPVIEIIPPPSGEFDYENKYNGQSQELCPPQHVETPLQIAAQTLAAEIHQLTGCRDFSRTDLMIKDGALFVLETNTIPGMTDQSLFPKAAAAAGIDMASLVDRLVTLASDH
jgi:D-alanine-D-alanine ligase